MKIGSGFKVDDSTLECSDYFTGVALTCTHDRESGTIAVSLEKDSQSASQLDLTAKIIKLGPIGNPSRALDTSTVDISIVEKEFGRVYARGTAPISVLVQGDICPDGCSECSDDGSCHNCETPSSTPLISPESGECVPVCPEGSFQSGARCIECNSECTTCHSLDQCSSCYGQEGVYFVDGRCL